MLFRSVQTIAAACRGGGSSPAASTATLKIKVNGVQQGQNYQVACPTTATASATNFPSLPIWMDLDIRAASAITFTLTLSNWSSSVNTPILDLSVFAYEF